MIAVIHEIIANVLRERKLDARVCYTHVALIPPDGATVEVECSDAGVAGELKRRFSENTATSGALVQTLPRPGAAQLMLVVSGVGDVRRQASHQSELVSQVIYGDAVTPLKSEGDWILSRLDDGYIGWIRDWHLKPVSPAALERFRSSSTHRIGANHAAVLSGPEAGEAPVASLVVGTPVILREGAPRGWAGVELPDGKSGFARSNDLEKHPARRATPDRLAATGRCFLGIPYLWGGNTPSGFDCSGLIQRIFRLNGVILPRDSDMQARFGAERYVDSPSGLEPGDLVFFGKSAESITHVGLVLPNLDLLHAYGQVIENSLDPTSARYSERLAQIWQSTRNPLASGKSRNPASKLRRSQDPNLPPPKKR
jgi:cell wall-associated NlpC family hydrolase